MYDTVPPGFRVTVWRKHLLNPKRKRGMRTICEVLREIYRTVEERGDTLSMARIEEATDMAKRMQKRLEVYAKGKVPGLISTKRGMVWISKEDISELTPDELNMLLEHRRWNGTP